jgi:hypothetical protein
LGTTAALWLSIVAIGAWHGLNPAMGWPLAVANGLAQRRAAAVFATLLPLGGGHLAAMATALVPFAWLLGYLSWRHAIQLAAGTVVGLFGVYKLLQPRHPRALARVRPTQLAWWSFLAATAHGAGLMLVPFMLGLCAQAPQGAGAVAVAHATLMETLARSTVRTALLVAGVHTLAMLAAALVSAWMVYRYLGLRYLSKAWFNLDRVWAGSLVVAGAAGIATAL